MGSYVPNRVSLLYFLHSNLAIRIFQNLIANIPSCSIMTSEGRYSLNRLLLTYFLFPNLTICKFKCVIANIPLNTTYDWHTSHPTLLPDISFTNLSNFLDSIIANQFLKTRLFRSVPSIPVIANESVLPDQADWKIPPHYC